ncbi:MAG: TonB-dependent receptor plug domain-containing protein [Tannerellaceae bacterium]|nr:TonB-dependent receptor plug domain-containing protein [Tannerellaceae bacterium]
MRTICLLLGFCWIFTSAAAQNDTLTGVLRDKNDLPIKGFSVILGKDNPLKTKTNKRGVFMFNRADLQDTLYIHLKKSKKDFAVPVNGHPYLTITIFNEEVNTLYQTEADADFMELINFNRNKMQSSDVITKSQIVKSGCHDVLCLLRRVGGVQVNSDGSVIIRGSFSFVNSTDPLIVIDGVQMRDAGILRTVPVETIEQLTVLKEAGEYGVQGANGVIVIKTTR